MSISLQTIKSNTNQEVASVYVQLNNKKYLFNVPDSFQRFRSEHRITSFQGANIFFTRCQPQYINGIFGFVQTLFSGDTSANQTKIFAPQPSYELFSAIKKSIIVGYCLTPYSIYEFGTKQCISGVNKEIQQQMMNKMEQKEKMEQEEFKAQDKDMNFASKFINDQDNFQDENMQVVRVLTNNNQSCSYICIPKKIPGTVNAQKLQEMKIMGKDRGILLKKGELTLESGETLYAKDFQDPDIASPVFLILDIQNMGELKEVMNNEQIQKLFEKNINSEDQIVRCIVHMTQNVEILKSQEYEQFVSQFKNEEIQHLFTSCNLKDECNQEIFDKQYFGIKPVHLNLMESFNTQLPNLYPKINLQESYKLMLQQKTDVSQLFSNNNNKINKQLALNYYQQILNPVKSIGYKYILNFKEEKLSLKTIEDEQMKNRIQEQIQNMKQGDAENVGIERFNPKIIFLGTGSMCPSKLRNVSGILILSHNGHYLFDCGEGTYSQMIERFGEVTTQQVLKDLKAIIITHSHSDHHLGCLHLLKMRAQVMEQCDYKNKEIFLSYPGNMCVWYDIYRQYVDQDFCKYVKLVFNQQITEVDQKVDEKFLQEQFQDQSYPQDSLQGILKETNFNTDCFIEMQNQQKIRLQTVIVEHCPQAYGIILEIYDENGENSVKITYSGDTRPCDNFIKYSQGADIMIHEGTFSDDLQKNAESHAHSTTKEAVMSAIKANAKNLILTHFSQRYSKTPKFDDEENQNQEDLSEEDKQYKKYLKEKTILAFDQLGGFLQQYPNYVDFTWYIAKNLNIDQEEKEEVEVKQEGKGGKKQKEKKQKK